MYKTAHYEYSTSKSGGANSALAPELDVQKNIKSLDSLLLDLKHERELSVDRGEFLKIICTSYRLNKHCQAYLFCHN